MNSVDSIKSDPRSPKDLPSGPLFHDGADVLEDVNGWCDVLRGVVRKTDHLTCPVLEIVEKHMLVAAPTDRIDSKELCVKLQNLISAYPSESSYPISTSILKALRYNNDQADISETEATSSVQRQSDSSGKGEDRKARKRRILNRPLQKTSHRSEVLNSALGGYERNLQDSIILGSSPSQSQDGGSVPLRHSSSKRRPPSLERSEAPHEPQNIFQAREQVERQGKRQDKSIRHVSDFFIKQKHPKDEILASYIHKCDIVSLLLALRFLYLVADRCRNFLLTMAGL
jgi:hypothetical protein